MSSQGTQLRAAGVIDPRATAGLLDGARPVARRDLLMAAALSLVATVAFVEVWIDILRMGATREELSYVLLAPAVIAWIAWGRRDRLAKCLMRGGWIGIVAILGGWLLHRYSYGTDRFFWRVGAVAALGGAIVAALGRDVMWKFAPAFAAMAFLIPISPMGRYALAQPLQDATTVVTQESCEAIGLEVTRSGNLLTINGQPVTVAEACNGMRMIVTLFMVCYVVAFTTPGAGPWSRLVVLALSPLVAIVANVIRLVPTVWLFGNSSPETAESFHELSGWVMTVLAFLTLMGVFRWMTSESDEPAGRSSAGGKGVLA